MNTFMHILAALIPFEEAVLPIFIHNAQSQKIAGIVMVGESAAAAVATQIAAVSVAKSAGSAGSASAQTAPAAAATTN